MEYILQTNHLTKVIDKRKRMMWGFMQKGKFTGFGAKWSRKTSVMKMLTNIWKPSGGSIEIFGGDAYALPIRF